MAVEQTLVRVYIFILACTLVSAAVHTFNYNYNNYYPRNIIGNLPRSIIGNLPRRRIYGSGFFGNQHPDPVCGRTLTKRDCPLFDFRSNLVSRDDYVDAISSESRWFNIYTKEIGSPSAYGKCQIRYDSPNSDGEFVQVEQCFNLDSNMCDDFTVRVRLEEDQCGRVKVQGVNASVDETIYSQDLNQYFWRDICEERIDEETCGKARYIDLVVKGSRLVDEKEGRVPDLTSLPWDLIAADLKNVYEGDFIDPEIRYNFLGEDCELD